jgi:3-phenylpropionate/trans-cinnamate dioxygenase ferredoxin component
MKSCMKVLRLPTWLGCVCTHEKIHLADGLVMDHTIECPKHNGRFDYTTGAATAAPVCINLKTYPVKVEASKVFIVIG